MNKRILIFMVVLAIATAGCVSNSPPYIVMADVNNDGIPDAVITQYSSQSDEDIISVFLGGANESFAKEVIKSSLEKQSTLVIDLNNDGNVDIVYKTAHLDSVWMVLYGKGDGTFKESKKIEIDDMQNIKKAYKSS